MHLTSAMEVTSYCIQIFLNISLLLSKPALSRSAEKPAFPVIYPDRLQFFEYESVFLNCSGDIEINAWKLMRRLYKVGPVNASEACSIPAPSCSIFYLFEKHSGEYWCENDEGRRSHALSISVTAGPVILNVSAQQVKEGSDVILRCIKQNSEKAHICDFYKNGIFLKTYYKRDMILTNVSKSDEALYKCNIPGTGASPESWLAVAKLTEKKGSIEETRYLTPEIILLLRTMAFLLLVVGLIFLMKCKVVNQTDQDTYASAENKTTGLGVRTSAVEPYSSEQDPMCSKAGF